MRYYDSCLEASCKAQSLAVQIEKAMNEEWSFVLTKEEAEKMHVAMFLLWDVQDSVGKRISHDV